jgi:hypothetical protein
VTPRVRHVRLTWRSFGEHALRRLTRLVLRRSTTAASQNISAAATAVAVAPSGKHAFRLPHSTGRSAHGVVS